MERQSLLMALFLSVLAAIQVTSAAKLKTTDTLTLDGLADLGCFLQVLSPTPITVKPDYSSADPIHTYSGCTTVTVISNMPLQVSVRVKGTVAAGGTWNATIKPALLAPGEKKTQVCVLGKNLHIENLTAGTKTKVAEVFVQVIPR